MRINTNMAAMNAWRNLTVNNGNLQKSLEKLSSGFRINKAADDAAGLAVSEKMRAQIRGLNQATRNAQDGIALVQTAEGGAGQIQNMLQRMRELTVQASSGALQDADRSQLDTEYQQLLSEIDRTANSVSYNKINLLAGQTGGATTVKTAMSSNAGVGDFTAGGTATAGGNYIVKVTALADNARATATGNLVATAGTGAATDSGYVLKVNGTSVYSAAAGQTVDKAQIAAAINSNTAVNTTVKANYDSTTGALTIESKNTGAAQTFTLDEYYGDGATRIGTDAEGFFATSGGTVTKNGVDASVTVTDTATGVTGAPITSANNSGITVATGITANLKSVGTTSVTVNTTAASSSTNLSLSVQIGANDGDTLSLSLSSLTAQALGINGSAIGTTALIGSGSSGVLQKLDSAINSVSGARATMGAAQNRLENIVGTLTVQSENLTGAESRIRDVDMAQEMSTFTKHNILSQASQSMLAQANQGTQGILSLLRG